MRSLIAALPLLALTACGGATGPQSVGSVAPPAGTGSTGGATGGTGGGVTTGTGGTGTGTGTTVTSPAHLLDVTSETRFNAVGAFQTLAVNETGVANQTGPVLYQANASTVRTPSGTVTYSPRDGIFTVSFVDAKAGLNTSTLNFQDPGHRADSPAWGVPVLNDFNYIQVVGGTYRAPSTTATTVDLGREDRITFFYQRPGAQTKYVSLAGYVRNAYDRTADATIFKAATESTFERGAMVFGQDTLRSQIPISGTGTFEGGLLASMVVNTSISSRTPNYFQWITGTSSLTFDFSAQTMSMLLTGTVSPANYGGQTLGDTATGVPGGSTFRAVGSGSINLVSTGGFTGRFSSVTFSNTNGTTVPIYDQVNPNNNVAGANSIDGTFYGPNAVNVGGNFRIVGGVPNQRVDILGAFTGAKK
ncbi:HupA family protein [Sphingomonas sp. RS2018]